ncbi:DoxX family protein [Actinophytocola algeriensis]|uniref:DoxX-like protein n=1 Tax=Actinophytocola algeriensis TaxID=1768010 RepID=A0A7W7VC01_9PSEU|nr:DoxX family protein [Actinophytocola algeriensis]MBB4904512.1 hypothetical protein [Actinophytocola algeriensis]MBE1476629.1 hypothetical protein [Actinophytocola algeriensis]
MHNTATRTQPVTVTATRAGQVISLLAVAFLLFDAVIHLLAIEPVVESFRELGFPGWQALPIGVLELACLALYAIPRTSVLGAVLLTGYLGGAVCAHVRAESPLLSTTLFPVYLGIAVWAGLYLRNEKVRALVRGA